MLPPISPMSQLANMEMALYGGFGTSMNAPSYLNGYTGGYDYSSYMNPWNNANIWGTTTSNYNPTFGQSNPSIYANQANQVNKQQDVAFQGLTAADKQALVEDYVRSVNPSEGLLECAKGNAMFALLMNPRLIAHPINTYRTLGETNKAFECIKEGSKKIQKAQDLWMAEANSNIAREGWLQNHKARARMQYKFFGGNLRGQYSEATKAGIEKLLKAQEKALKTGNIDAYTKATAELKYVYGANDGWIGRGFDKVKGWFGGKSSKNAAARLDEITKAGANGKVAGVEKIITELNATKANKFGDILKRGGGIKGGLLFMGLEFAMSFGKIKTAFGKDNETGMKQLGQTTLKAAGNAAGWALGEAAALAAFTKWGASIGTAFGPGVGTLIGGAVGLIGGGLGMCLAGKLTKGLVGQDVADGIEAEKMASTQEGQVQLLQNTMQRMQSGEKVSANAQQAVQKIMTQYA